MYRAESYFGSDNLQHQAWHEPCVRDDLGIYSRMAMTDLEFLQDVGKVCQILILEPGPALARGSEHIIFLIVSRQEERAIGSSPSSSSCEGSYNDQVYCVLHLRFVFSFVFDPTPSSCPCLVD